MDDPVEPATLREQGYSSKEIRNLISDGCLLITREWRLVQHPNCDHDLLNHVRKV